MSKKKVAVLVSGNGSNLQALIDYTNTNNANFEISIVISNNESAYALSRAKNNKIKTIIISSKDKDRFENTLISVLEEYHIDLIVLAGFMCILSKNFTSKYPNKIINIHPSLIPSFCGKGFYGLHVHEAVLEYGVKITGATTHFVNEIPDGGKIIMQKAVEVLPNDTPETLQKRVMQEAEWIILPKSVDLVAGGENLWVFTK